MTALKKILYAEDEPDIQMIVETVIQSLSDYEIKICENGKKLLAVVDEFKPDLILLDVMMPEMDGPTTFANLKENEATKSIPVVFMTAKAQVHEVKALEDAGAIGIITKPFDPVLLCSEIAKLWEKSQNG